MNNDLLDNLPGDDSVQPVATPFQPGKKFVVTYSRTFQVRQYEPLTPAVSIELTLSPEQDVASEIRTAMGQCREAVREVFAGVIPQVMATMEEQFVLDYFKVAPQNVKNLLRSQLIGPDTDVEFPNARN